ncbi:MAG: SMR family transporter [Patescibacteria group bacterium]|jgi:small multidrug resistance pump|nr:SMR family transporter [Patescibacteria group bacterium]
MNLNPFIWHILIINFFDLVGILFAKYYNLTKNNWLLASTVICFGLAGFFFARSLRYEGVAITNVLWIAISVILVTIVGYFFFKEHISPIQIFGIFVIIGGLVLINLK